MVLESISVNWLEWAKFKDSIQLLSLGKRYSLERPVINFYHIGSNPGSVITQINYV